MLLGGPLGSWQVLLMSPKGRNVFRDDFVNLNISLNSIASFGSLVPSGLALLFCFSFIRRSLSIVTTWSKQYNYIIQATFYNYKKTITTGRLIGYGLIRHPDSIQASTNQG